MPFESEPAHDPQQLVQVKEGLRTLWRELSAEHQATMLLALLRDVIGSEYRGWVLDAIWRLYGPGQHDNRDQR